MKAVRLPLLLLLFAASGVAASVYEIVWFQLLQLVIGSTAISLAILLGTFMGGMCIGSLAFPGFFKQTHPLRIYAVLEAGIAAMALLVLFFLPYAGGLYRAIGSSGSLGILWRALLCAVCLIPPAVLMGATLPVVARLDEVTRNRMSRVGLLYAANIAGAVFGSLLAGFYLLRFYDVAKATYCAAVINVLIAVSAYGMLRITVYEVGINRARSIRHAKVNVIYAVTFISGLCAMAAEVIWTRLLSLLFGASVYAFSIILAVFLFGLWIGSTIGAVVSRWSEDARRVLGVCQILLTIAIAWAAFMLADVLPFWPLDPSLTDNPWLNFQVDVVRCTLAIFPAACLWGASFPLAMAAAADGKHDSGKLVGSLYAANTVGGIVGSAAFSVAFIQWFGSRVAQQMLIVLSLVAGLLALVRWWRTIAGNLSRAAALVAATAVAGACVFIVSPTPAGVMAYGRSLPR